MEASDMSGSGADIGDETPPEYAALPDARNVRWHVSGGLTADHHDVFYFETTPEEVDRLVAGRSGKRGCSARA